METRLKVLMVASEAVPYAKTGGLADVLGALPRALAEQGCDVRCIMPRYRSVDPAGFGLKSLLPARSVSFAGKQITAEILAAPEDGVVSGPGRVQWLFVDAPEFFDRDELYGMPGRDYSDSCERFAFFCQRVLAATRELDWRPNVIHCHDWQSGLIPAYLKIPVRTPVLDTFDPFFRTIPSIFTIHNIAYQGMFDAEKLWVTGFPPERFNPQELEYWGQINFLKTGLVFADKVTTVSPRYSEEIRTEDFGCGMDGVLRSRAGDLVGILNGIDAVEWNPASDPHLPAHYRVDDLQNKRECRRILSKEVRLAPRVRVPLIGMVSRLDPQKGFDLLESAIPKIMALGAQMVVLGTGAKEYHTMLTSMARRYKGQFSAVLAFDNALARRIEAGADMFLMPSRFEPCGLSQMYSLRYGTVPIVHATGGLADTVRNYDGRTRLGNGFSFAEYSAPALVAAVRRAAKVFGDRTKWEALMRAGMDEDFSWNASARRYRAVYDELLEPQQQPAPEG